MEKPPRPRDKEVWEKSHIFLLNSSGENFMKWFDIDYPLTLLRYIKTRITMWWQIPDKNRRYKILDEINSQAKELFDSAVRRDKWMAKYENRPEKSVKELTAEVLEDLKKSEI